MLAAAGAGGAWVAVKERARRSGLAQGVLTGLFLYALATSVMLGFGMNEVFTDAELRRYPLRERERTFARHFTGVVDPFWLLVIALDLGLALGLYLFGALVFLAWSAGGAAAAGVQLRCGAGCGDDLGARFRR